MRNKKALASPFENERLFNSSKRAKEESKFVGIQTIDHERINEIFKVFRLDSFKLAELEVRYECQSRNEKTTFASGEQLQSIKVSEKAPDNYSTLTTFTLTFETIRVTIDVTTQENLITNTVKYNFTSLLSERYNPKFIKTLKNIKYELVLSDYQDMYAARPLLTVFRTKKTMKNYKLIHHALRFVNKFKS